MHPPLQSRRFARFLYTKNPFYLLSSAFVLVGLHLSFGAHRGGGADGLDRWLLLGSLAGYTVLSAATAFLVVRLGRVWDDARSLMLVVLLQFFTISASLDDFCNSEPDRAPTMALLAFLFSAAVTEALLHGLSIRLPSLLRGPYYLLLALLYAYPLWISPEITHLAPEAIRWRLLLFPVCGAAGLLTLLPAARRGVWYTADSGTPWRWPLYPWTIFFFLTLGLAARSYMQCVSFDRLPGWESVFGVYFLVPLLLAVAAVVIELAGSERRFGVQIVVLLLAPALLWLAIRDGFGDTGYRLFYDQVTAAVGSPLWLTLLGLIVLFAFAWERGTPLAEAGCSALLLAATVVGPTTFDSMTLTPLNWLPLLVLGGVQLVEGVKRRSSLRLSVATVSLAASTVLGIRELPLPAVIANYAAPVVAHVAVVALGVIGATLHDWMARLLRKVVCVGMALGVMAVVYAPRLIDLPEDSKLGYVTAITLLAVQYWSIVRERWSLAAAVVNVGTLVTAQSWWLSGVLLHQLGPEGFVTLLVGVVCFAVAAMISAVKAGALPHLRRWWLWCRVHLA